MTTSRLDDESEQTGAKMFGLFRKRVPLIEATDHTRTFVRQTATDALQKFLDHYGRHRISNEGVFQIRHDNFLAAWSYVVFLFGLKSQSKDIQELSYLALRNNIPMRENIVALQSKPAALALANLDELLFLILDESFNSNGLDRREAFALERISDSSMIAYVNLRADFRTCLNYLDFLSNNFKLV